jgi:cytochrome c553
MCGAASKSVLGSEDDNETKNSACSGRSTKEGRGGRAMKVIGLRLALQTAILAIVFAATSRADDRDTAALSKRDLQAKLQYCEVCHGVSAQGFLGYYPIPRLAGQQIAYIENQLKGFVERKRTSNIMFNVGHVLSPATITALATNFHDLNPKPLGGAPKELVTTGKKIYDEGIPAANVLPCASCHGPEAKGDGQFPRLAGQLFAYVTLQLTNWSKERGENTSSMMAPIARSLTESQVKAVAAYVSYLE